MGERIVIDRENTVIILFNKNKNIWEDKTFTINALFKSYYYGNFTGYDIYYRDSNKKLFYPLTRVEIVKYVRTIDVSKHDVIVDDNIYSIDKIEEFQNGFFRIKTANKVIITQYYKLSKGKYKDTFRYYKNLASYAGQISKDIDPLYFLSQNYTRITPDLKSIVYQYLQGTYNNNNFDDFIVVPFDFNQSQHKAIKEAFSNSISVIEGPPGTGKTQTILNLISNIITKNQNCAIISNNNTAVDNVYEKLTEERISFIAANLGNVNKVENFLDNATNDDLIEFLKTNQTQTKVTDRQEIFAYSAILKKYFDLEIKIAKLKNLLIEVQTEKKNQQVDETKQVVINEKLKSGEYIKLIHRLEETRKIRFIERLRTQWKYKVKLTPDNTLKILDTAETLFYQKRIFEINNEIKSIQIQLSKINKENITIKLKNLSKEYLLKKVYAQYKSQTLKEFNKDSYKRDYYNFLKRYPVVLSTSQSLLNNAPKGFLFDYLIIDEASQGDLLSSILAMSCASNLVVVGDSRQLQQIDEERLFEKSRELAKKYDIEQSYIYESNSILRSVRDSVKDVPVTLLREHYRCAPDIINFCNKMFYDNELIPMTTNTEQHIEIIKTVSGNHARKNPNGPGMYNQREIDELEVLIKDKNKNQIGVITPFRYQANLISALHANDGLDADTIHKFQGRQKKEIYMSFVVNSLDKNPDNVENKLYDFVTNEKLLNVAISRGKKKVTAIVSDKIYHSKNNIIHDFIKYSENLYGNQITKTSKVKSVFDYLYGEYDHILKNKFKDKPKEHKTELLMCELIDELLKDYNKVSYRMHVRLSKILHKFENLSTEELNYVKHPWTHVDFLFYNKVSKEKMFVLELDGIQFHEQNDKQLLHDKIKDKILNENDIVIYRFKTNEANEKSKLAQILNSYKY